MRNTEAVFTSSGTEVSEVKGFDSYEVTLGDLMRGERATLGKSLLDVQRDLRIKAAYIAAIENSDPSAFQTPGFIAGYVRSYARYLGLDPEEIFAKFCVEAGYDGVHPDIRPSLKARHNTPANSLRAVPSLGNGLKSGLNPGAKAATSTEGKAAEKAQKITANPVSLVKQVKAGGKAALGEPLFDSRTSFAPINDGFFGQISFAGIGSVLVLAALILGLGYGAWALLQDIQRVEFAPTTDAQEIAAPPLPLTRSQISVADNGTAPPPADAGNAAALEQLYRPKELDVPVMTPRDGPIAALDPRRIGALVSNNGGVQAEETAALMKKSVPRVTEIAPPKVAVVAIRPAWVRISKADGTVLFEKILNGGESFLLPKEAGPITLRAGNSGAVYITLDGKPYGPVGRGTSVAKNVVLGPKKILARFKAVSNAAAVAALDSPKVITLKASR